MRTLLHQEHRTCGRCVMDTSDSSITFDLHGFCHHCTAALQRLRALPDLNDRQDLLVQTVRSAKMSGRGREYDGIIGLSGGLDSSYGAYVAAQQNLRLLAVHLDNGWNSELAVANIEKLVRKLGMDLHTDVLNWEEFRDLQVAFLKASVPDAEIPTDHAITASIYRLADKMDVPLIVSGTNLSTESILPESWTHGILDWRYIRSVHRQFGTVPLWSFPRLTLWNRATFRLFQRVRSFSILNYVEYNRRVAIDTLEREFGWRAYEGKHHESTYTKFFQEYILPVKFGIDKRKAHLSSLICSGQITRDQALETLKHKPWEQKDVLIARDYVIKKLGLSTDEFEAILNAPPKCHRDYPTSDALLSTFDSLRRLGTTLGVIPRNDWL